MKKDVYILAAKQISVQSPLVEEWMEKPIPYSESYIRAIDPDYSYYFEPNAARRLGKILKRALLTSRQVMEATGISTPDAIITGTGLGCIENTEFFLEALTLEGEEMLKPTHFMQSTHNTISSLIAIDAHCHGYNSTYAHKGISFECALLDAFMQLSNGQIQTALVGAHDEMTPKYFSLLKRIGYPGNAENGFSGETAVSLMLGTGTELVGTRHALSPLCRVNGIEMLYVGAGAGAGADADADAGVGVGARHALPLHLTRHLVRHALTRLLDDAHCPFEDIDAVMIGTNGNAANDAVYEDVCSALFSGKKLLRYKHLFGESYTAPALGVYAAATCLHRQRMPAHLFAPLNPPAGGQQSPLEGDGGFKHILFYNQFANKNHSLILLSSCGE